MSKWLAIVSGQLLALLAFIIWTASIAVAAAYDFVAMVATTLLPGIAQVYWIVSIQKATGKVPEPLTALCVIWLCLLVVFIYANHYALRAEAKRAGMVLQ